MKVTKVMMILLALALLAAIPAAAQEPPLEACAVEPLVAGGGNYGTIVGRVLVDPVSGGGATVKFDTTAAPNYYFGTFRGHYDIPGNWYITSYHVDASCLVEGDWFPVNRKGNPVIGNFEYSQNNLAPGTQTVTLNIADPNCSDDMFFVAAHATVAKQLPDMTWKSETAWALEAPFRWLTGADSWAQYFQVDTAACAVPSAPPLSPPNRKPVANPDSYETKVDTNLVTPSPNLLANDSDPDGDSIKVVLPVATTTSAGGTLSVGEDGKFTYLPPLGFTGTDSFTYTITDGTLVSDPATVTIRVTRNEPPRPTPTPTPAVAKCYQCSGLDCLLNPTNDMCQPGQDLCYTTVDDTNGVVRTITRGCGASTDVPPPAEPSDTCKNVEVALVGTLCKFYCDGVTNTSCNTPPSLIPANGRVPPWQ